MTEIEISHLLGAPSEPSLFLEPLSRPKAHPNCPRTVFRMSCDMRFWIIALGLKVLLVPFVLKRGCESIDILGNIAS